MAAGRKDSPLFVQDHDSGKRFLVDTGAQVSVLPATGQLTRSYVNGPTLLAANGSAIRTFGTRTESLHIGSQRYTWPFILADVAQPILGATRSWSISEHRRSNIRFRAYCALHWAYIYARAPPIYYLTHARM